MNPTTFRLTDEDRKWLTRNGLPMIMQMREDRFIIEWLRKHGTLKVGRALRVLKDAGRKP